AVIAVPPVAAAFTAPPAIVEAAPAPPPRAPVRPSDDQLVRTALQRYRVAYEELDARSAQAVWPSVDAAALNRAFGGLQSQRLNFDDCDVRLQGGVATATCRGSARYVPRVGSRETRVEPHVW